MIPIYLERHDDNRNLHRYYRLTISAGIFGEWALNREWGRVGSPGTVRSNWFPHECEAIDAAWKLARDKRKKGYRPPP